MTNHFQLKQSIITWANELGFQRVGVADIHLQDHAKQLEEWLAHHYEGSMAFMSRHRDMRLHPEILLPQTLRVITVAMSYFNPGEKIDPRLRGDGRKLMHGNDAYLSSSRRRRSMLWIPASAGMTMKFPPEVTSNLCGSGNDQKISSEKNTRILQIHPLAHYARGKDYHSLIRKRLEQLAKRIQSVTCQLVSRAFCDSAPVLEKALAEKSGVGWIGKHTLAINPSLGSYFFLGELFVDLPLPIDRPIAKRCGTCSRCLLACPTGALVAPYQLDARRCIAYLTIEHPGSIPEALRPLIGTRIFGCDACQQCCPWNRFAQTTTELQFSALACWQEGDLVSWFGWTELEFLAHTQGTAIRRLGYERWLRNIAVALGNCFPKTQAIKAALLSRLNEPSELVREHVQWALDH